MAQDFNSLVNTYLKNSLIIENVTFDNWVMPSDRDIRLEYKVEYEIKFLKDHTNDAFPTVEDFLQAVKDGQIIEVDEDLDYEIANRSRTEDKEDLLDLISTYASYPEYRNEDTVDAIYKGFANNEPMKLPSVLRMPDDDMIIMSGNTRMDVAFHMGITPKVLLIDVPEK